MYLAYCKNQALNIIESPSSATDLIIVTCTIGVNGHEDFIHSQSWFDRFRREDNTGLAVPEIKPQN